MRVQPNLGPRRPLYVMIKPPFDVAGRIAILDRNDLARPADLLHSTFLGLGDLGYLPEEFLPLVIQTLSCFEASAFPVIFNRIDKRRVVALRSKVGLMGFAACQKRMIDHLRNAGFPLNPVAPAPHITINYRGDRRGAETIDGFSWTVNELLLVESVYGEARHVVHAHIPLLQT